MTDDPDRPKHPGGRPTKYDPSYCEWLTLCEAKKLVGKYVYGLCRENGSIFYVGQTRSPKVRFQSHSECRSSNPRLREILCALRGHVRVVILRSNPDDLNSAEREEIARHKDEIVNLIGADSWVWSKHSDVPWAAGTGIKSPSAYAMGVASEATKRVVRDRMTKMKDWERCVFELALLGDMPPLRRAMFDKWLSAVTDKMIRCLEAHELDMGNACR